MAAADESPDAFADMNSDAHAHGSHETSALPSAVCDWLSARVMSSERDVVIAVAVHSGRSFFRADHGASGSTIEHPVRTTCSAAELAAAVRRWARSVGHGAQIDGSHAGDVRVAIGGGGVSRS